jgi:ATP-dependent exoDNAse (exonuclease V) beta subunit
VFIDLEDIVTATRMTALDKLRLIYTAVTRARDAIVVLREPTMTDLGL